MLKYLLQKIILYNSMTMEFATAQSTRKTPTRQTHARNTHFGSLPGTLIDLY